jgi:hypothetical protein
MRRKGPPMTVRLITMFGVLLIGSIMAGCGAQRSTVRSIANDSYKSSSASIEFDTSKRSVPVEDKYKDEFTRVLKQRLETKGFKEGKGLILRYWFSQADEGSRSARYWAGLYGAGTGKIQVAVEFYDVNGLKLAETDNEGTVSGGLAGGTYSEAILNSAEAIASYTKKAYFAKDANPVAIVSPAAPAILPGTTAPTPQQAPSSQPAPVSAVAFAQPAVALKTWQMAVNTNPQGAIIKAYDANQELYQIGKSPAGFLWPLQTQADAVVIMWQGRQVALLPTFMESISVDFTQQPPVVKGATVINSP